MPLCGEGVLEVCGHWGADWVGGVGLGANVAPLGLRPASLGPMAFRNTSLTILASKRGVRLLYPLHEGRPQNSESASKSSGSSHGLMHTAL